MRIVFMGTPEFAVPSMKALIDAGHQIIGVFTQPDKPQGRKMLLTPPPVKVLAETENIPVYQPMSLKNPEQAKLLEELNPDAIVVAAYGKMLPKAVLDIPKYGCINVHASLLPKYRGAAPIQAAILNGDEKTGVTTQLMGEECDKGDILLMESTAIGPDENAQTLTTRLSQLGAGLIVRTLEAIQSGTVQPVAQNEEESSHVSLISKKMSPIDWNRPAQEIHNQVRALFPWPCASSEIHGRRLKIYRSRLTDDQVGEPGLILPEKDEFIVCCGNGTALELLEVQSEGGKKMSGCDYLHGHQAQGLKLG